MVLIKSTPDKNRSVFELNDCYRKIWNFKDVQRLEKHVSIMKGIWPDYILRYGWTDDSMWLDVKKIEGTLASKLEHTDEFIKKVYSFCLKNIKRTSPYAHYDWVLSNIIVNGDEMFLIDWDNVGIYTYQDVHNKLISDLKSAFGDKFDPSSI
jgi:hypothetical protein